MGQPDLTIRFLAERCLPDLLPALLPDHQITVLRVERTQLKVLERDADEIVLARVDGVESVFHVEFAIRHDANLPSRVLAYQALLRVKHYPLPVFSMVVYLMPDPPREPVPAGISRHGADPQLDFRYPVFCPWRQSLGLNELRRTPQLAPLAVLTPGIREPDLADLRELILEQQAMDSTELLAFTYFMAGRRFARDLLDLFLRSREMEESSTYRALEQEAMARGEAKGEARGEARGRAQGILRAVVDFLEARLGKVPVRSGRALQRLDADALDQLFKQLLRAKDDTEIRALLPRS